MVYTHSEPPHHKLILTRGTQNPKDVAHKLATVFTSEERSEMENSLTSVKYRLRKCLATLRLSEVVTVLLLVASFLSPAFSLLSDVSSDVIPDVSAYLKWLIVAFASCSSVARTLQKPLACQSQHWLVDVIAICSEAF